MLYRTHLYSTPILSIHYIVSMKTICPFFFTLLFFGLVGCQSEQTQENTTTTITKDSSSTETHYVVISNGQGGLDTIPDQNAQFYETIEFYSLDSLLISGNYYHVNDSAPCILLCHQARWNKYEYDSIAIVLQAKGYNCLAIDQRSGGLMNDERINQTFDRASAKELPTDYLDAEQDIIAAIRYFYNQQQRPIILWGSSYSSTLAMHNGLPNDSVAAVVAFSPGDYFSEQKGSLVPLIKASSKPFFVTSSKEEAPALQALLSDKVLSNQQVQFIPTDAGHHGSRALWASKEGNEAYWTAINAFLESLN